MHARRSTLAQLEECRPGPSNDDDDDNDLYIIGAVCMSVCLYVCMSVCHEKAALPCCHSPLHLSCEAMFLYNINVVCDDDDDLKVGRHFWKRSEC